MTDEQKQKRRENRKQYRENMTLQQQLQKPKIRTKCL